MPPMKIITTQKTLAVNNSDVNLVITIGDAQAGRSIAHLDYAVIDVNQRKIGIEDASIGKGSNIKGQTLEVITTVDDINRATNNTSVTYEFTGTNLLNPITVGASVDHDRDSITYIGEFRFS